MSDTRDDRADHDDPAERATDDLVRRLLADARADSPVPDDVATRLDDTLAALLAERQNEVDPVSTVATTHVRPGHPPARADAVTDLSGVRARRRRRIVVGIASAAAFVVAVGVALPRIIGQDSADRSGSSAADRSVGAPGQPGPVTLRAASAKEAVEAYVAGLDQPVATPAPPDPPAPAADASPLRGSRDGDESSSAATNDLFASAADTLTCEEPGPGEVHPATYDGRPAVLVLTGTEDDSVLARVVICDDGAGGEESPLRRATDPAFQFVVPQP